MGDDQPSPSSSRGKHRRSCDDASDEEPKRRKHHHRRHHHSHRHHSKHGEYGNEEGDPIFSEKKSEPALRIMPANDELEEGEIVEEEEEGGGEIEYVEVRNDHASPFPMQEPSCEEDLIPEHTLDISSTANNTKTLINCCAKENDKDGGFLFEATVDSPNNVGDYGNLAEVESRTKLNPLIGVPKKEKQRDIDLNGFKSRERSRSPAFKKSSYWLNCTDRDDHLNKYFDPSAEKDRSTPKLGRQVDGKGIPVDKDFSISPRSSNDRHKETERSSSSSKHCGEIGNRDQSMCDDHATGKLYNQVREDDAEDCIPSNHSERKIEGTRNSDYKRSRGHDRLDKYIHSDRESLKKREGSVYSRHNGYDSRHSGRDRLREGAERRDDGQDRGKEVEISINGFRDRDGPPNEKGVYRDREMSRSSSRYDGRESRHDRRDKERYKDREREKYSRRDRERVKERDRSTERFMVIRIRNVKGESARNMDNTDQDKSRNRERKNHSYKDRERVDHKERTPNCYHDEKRDSGRSKYDKMEYHKERTKYNESAKDVTINIHCSEEEKRYHLRVEEVEDYQGRIEQQLAMQDEEDIEKIKEESRKRRQAILEKYKQKQKLESFERSPSVHDKEELVSKEKDMEQVSKTFDSVDNAGVEEVVGRHDSFDAYVAETSFTLGKSPVQNGLSVTEKSISASGLGEGSPKSERSKDMFCDDIFGDSPASIRKSGKDGLLKIERSGLHDNWDDAEGYYSHRLGEVLDGRYEIIAAQGKGVFSTVVRVKDLKAAKVDPEEVAIKIIRSNDTMYKAGMEELVILKKLSGSDPEDKRHCVRFLSSFKYRNHLCLTFESLHMNLREVLKKFGRNIGLRLTAVRAYAKQLFIALKHLKNCGVLHCDIKPDNMLVNEAKNVLKLCDFGNAMFAGKNEITPYLVSRFYRAPEIILGLPYDHPLDIWSVGCCLFELYTGKVLFPGPSNNDMLRLHMELKGPFPKKMLRKAAFIDQHFDQDLNFHAAEEDPVTKKAVKRLLLNIKPKDIGTLISGSPGEDPKMLANFKDLLERVFVLDPEKRMTVSQALSHPFITGK